MFKPDVIICHPFHLDYPLWRKFIHENRARFKKVIIVFTDMNVRDLDYRGFVQNAMAKDDVIFLDCLPAKANEDWRSKAVNMALTVSDAGWVWFTEQDFTPLEGFWDAIYQREDISVDDVMAIKEGDRIHPACLFVKRKLIDETSKDFGVTPDEADHFYKFVRELGFMYIIPQEFWAHMNGLSQNMWMLQQGIDPNYKPKEFKEYCKKCLKVDPIHPDFFELFSWYTEKE